MCSIIKIIYKIGIGGFRMNKVIKIGKEDSFPCFEFSINFKLDKKNDDIYLSIINEVYENEFDKKYVSDLMRLMYIDKKSNNLTFNLQEHLIFLNKELEQSLNSIFSGKDKLFSKKYNFSYSPSNTFYLHEHKDTDKNVETYFIDILDRKNVEFKFNLEVGFSKSTLQLLKEIGDSISNFYK